MTEFAAEVRPDAPHVLTLSGEMDIATVDGFLTTARAVLGQAETAIELDFGAVTFIDSTGIGALCGFARRPWRTARTSS